MFELYSLSVGMLGANCYILHAAGTSRSVVIDPGADPERIAEKLPCPVGTILLTHGHFDHIGAAHALADKYGASIAIHRLDAPYLSDPYLNASQLTGISVPDCSPDHLLEDQELYIAEGMAFRVLHTPGHTPGSCCFHLEDVLFTGDTMFAGGCGRTDLPGGSDRDMMHSLRFLNHYLSQNAIRQIFPGHGG